MAKQHTNKLTKTHLLSIDAWRECEGSWSWNQWYTIEDDIYLPWATLKSARKLLAFCRKSDWLPNESKGRLSIEDDGYNVVIQNKDTYEPLFAFCYGEYL